MQIDTSKKKALVLSGGGGRGAFECGVLERLSELGWEPDVLVGTSIGSMNAAVWAVGGIENVKRMWEGLRNRDMHRFFRPPPWQSLLDRAAWKKTLETYADEEQLQKTEVPLYIVTMNVKIGHPLVYTNSSEFDEKKPLYKPVERVNHKHLLASSSIPYVYASTVIDDTPHWDGAIMYNSPLQPAVDSGAEQILIVLLSPYHDLNAEESELPPPPKNLFAKAGYLFDMVMMATFENDFEQMRKVNRRVRTGKGVKGHREIEAALIGPDEWLPIFDIVRYKPPRISYLREKGRQAAEATWNRVQTYGWDSLHE